MLAGFENLFDVLAARDANLRKAAADPHSIDAPTKPLSVFDRQGEAIWSADKVSQLSDSEMDCKVSRWNGNQTFSWHEDERERRAENGIRLGARNFIDDCPHSVVLSKIPQQRQQRNEHHRYRNQKQYDVHFTLNVFIQRDL